MLTSILFATFALSQHGGSQQSLPARGNVDDAPHLPAFIRTELAGESAPTFPHFRFVSSIFRGASLKVALDVSAFPSYVGASANVYVVANKNAGQWNQDPTLVDVTGGAENVVIQAGNLQANTFTVDTGTLPGSSGTTLGLGYDVVFDFDLDGKLSDGDVIDGYTNEPGIWVIADTNTVGPYTVSSVTYSGGSFLGEICYYPSNIATLGELPLIVVSHGNGHNYTWYSHIGNRFASWGYVVMSHQNNTMPGIETASTTTLTNTDYFLANLGTIAGGALLGHVDRSHIVWIGHSRGGEGVVRAYKRVTSAQYTPTQFVASDIKLVVSMAPVTFLTAAKSDPGSVPYLFIYGASDGDVTGAPNGSSSPFALYERAHGPKSSLYLQGVGHAWFHNHGGTCYCTGPNLSDEATTHLVQLGFFLPIVDYYAKGNPAGREFLERGYADFRPPSIPASMIVASENRPAVGDYVAIDDYQTQPALNLSSSGGAVTYNVASVFEGNCEDNDFSFDWNSGVPMNGMTRAMVAEPADDAKAVVFDWGPGTSAYYELELVPALHDLTSFAAISFRACEGTRHPNTDALNAQLDFALTLRDSLGHTSTIPLADYGHVTRTYRRTGSGTGAGWANEFTTFRVPIRDFAAEGTLIDLTDVAAVRLELGPPTGNAPGRLGLDDVILTND